MWVDWNEGNYLFAKNIYKHLIFGGYLIFNVKYDYNNKYYLHLECVF